MVAVFGTMARDVIHIGLGVPYVASTAFFALALAVVFLSWYTSRRRCPSTASTRLGASCSTGRGDHHLRSRHGRRRHDRDHMGLGYFISGVMFGVLFVLPALAYRWIASTRSCLLDRYHPYPSVRGLVSRTGLEIAESERPGGWAPASQAWS